MISTYEVPDVYAPGVLYVAGTRGELIGSIALIVAGVMGIMQKKRKSNN
ncbi:MAG: hypothetical protein K5679_02945 [Lachnospiraceae bacterium]|nr:hypothetical protein [Lachnospiraceae bacterium]